MSLRAPRIRFGPLWHHADFIRLWTGDTLSQFGAQITSLAIPLLAVTSLQASTFEVGMLETLQNLAFLVIGLPAGAWIDRLIQRHVMITADLVRFGLLLSLPVAHLFDVLTLWHLYAVAVIFGMATVFFDVSYQSYLPGLVPHDNLVEGNSKLQASQSVARVAGPGVGGFIIGWLRPVGALWASSFGYLWSAFWVWRIKARQPAHDPTNRQTLVHDIGEGLGFVFRHPLLRAITMTTGISNFFSSIGFAVMMVFLARTLGLHASIIGIVFMFGSIGGLIGVALTQPLGKAIGQGPTLWISTAVSGLMLFVAPFIQADWTIWLFAAAFLVMDVAIVVYNITQVSFRQSLCPPHLLGRMNATIRFVVWGTMPLGSFAGALIGEHFGVRTALFVGAIGAAFSFLPIFFSRLRQMATLPTGESGAAGVEGIAESDVDTGDDAPSAP
ncbi:MFS transporter [Spelaeicoccus albus]|uniref:MFS family permease n=1 Tax=Spelaeicoccus albus TaxID=1280376 RepID=A0A7Z0IJA8_9MICO|nr:MFS transporter [Spelaeicoccus albus]NYI69232.1 MFS family permease [Spelaeicoccus albus]